MNKEVLKKLEQEKKELKEKIQKAKAFMYSAEYDKLDVINQRLLDNQLNSMIEYYRILSIRISFNLKWGR